MYVYIMIHWYRLIIYMIIYDPLIIWWSVFPWNKWYMFAKEMIGDVYAIIFAWMEPWLLASFRRGVVGQHRWKRHSYWFIFDMITQYHTIPLPAMMMPSPPIISIIHIIHVKNWIYLLYISTNSYSNFYTLHTRNHDTQWFWCQLRSSFC